MFPDPHNTPDGDPAEPIAEHLDAPPEAPELSEPGALLRELEAVESAAGDLAAPDVGRSARARRGDVLVNLVLVLVLAVGAWLRFDAQNWDDYTHLHPDERFLVDVVSSLGGPLRFTDQSYGEQEAHRARCELRYPAKPGSADDQSVLTTGHGGYFDADCSPLNPNNVGKGLYVYGEFPLFTVHAAGVARSQLSRDVHALLEAFDAAKSHTITTHWEGYSGAQLIGRSISALADVLTILVLFLLGRRLYGRWVGLLAAALYAVAVFPIQQSHFWTVDAFTTFWVTLALYFAVRALDGASVRRGPIPLFYALIWLGTVAWETGLRGFPVLGLASLAAFGAVIFAATSAVGAWLKKGGHRSGDLLPALTGVYASVSTLVCWLVVGAVAPRDFSLLDDMLALGAVSLVYALAVAVAYVAASEVRRQMQGREAAPQNSLAVGSIGVMWVALMLGYLVGGLGSLPTLFVALAAVALLLFDVTELTDYALFGVALGGAVASRVNAAPLAGIIVVAAGIRVLPALGTVLPKSQRSRLVAYALTGVVAAALVSFVVFRLLQPHAFQGPGIFGLKFNPGWREDISEAAYLTSGEWDGPPNHQWASRTPYFFPWRNIVLWGMGIPLGLVAWGAWVWAGVSMARAGRLWTRHAIPFLWILVAFGWLGGRWVTTMRYFLPIYPPLVLFAAWALIALVREAHAAMRQRRFARPAVGRLAFGGAVALLAVVLGYTTVYGFAFHNIARKQLTRVAASRWFQETVPGDFGVWVERPDGTRKLVNIGRSHVATPPAVTRLEQNETVEQSFTVMADARLTRIALNRLLDPLEDDLPEAVRVRLFRDDPNLGRQLLFEDTIRADFAAVDGVYGAPYAVEPDDEIILEAQPDPDAGFAAYVLELTVVGGGPVTSVRDVTDDAGTILSDISVGLQLTADRTLTFVDLTLEEQPLLIGHGDDIPAPPTHWTVGGSDSIQFQIPVDGVIREVEIPHLGDPLRDAGVERVRLTLTGPDGAETSAVVAGDFNAGANPLGPARTVIFDPPLTVARLDAEGNRQTATLTIKALDPVYTSGSVIAWEGDWDDPVPWATCPLPDDVIYRDDLPSGLSSYDCAAVNLHGAHYQSLKLWMVAEDDAQKYHAMTNALDQADYIVISSNRFYDSLSRIPWRWPMTKAYYDALFDGRLGFELVRTFESVPELGPFRIRDQVLPFDDLPGWVNEHWEAEEAFHVYDHPIVLVFRKTDAYSPENTRAILNSVSLRSVKTALPGYVADPEPVGVVPWGGKQASAAPTLLQFDDETWEIQREGGTWRDLFDPDSLLNRSQVLAVIVWWLLMIVAGWIAWPLLYVALPALPDRAYPVAKITAWLVIGWFAWVGGTAKLLTWTRGGIALLLLALAVLSALVIWRRRAEFLRYIQANWRFLLAMEALSLALFVAFLGVRLGNPDLWHNVFGGEKPMDFAYFNAVLRSTVFPPLDPWFARGFINYYYFGYVIVGAPVKLLGIQPSVAYNLIIPTLFSMTGVGVFSIAYNWVRSRAVAPGAIEGATSLPFGRSALVVERDPGQGAGGRDEPDDPADATTRGRFWFPLPKGNAWLAGTLALLLAVVLGNLGTVHVIVTNVAALDGWSQPLLFHQQRQQEIDGQRDRLYQEFYADEVARFRKEHGYEPTEAGDVLAVTQAVQARLDEAIDDYVNHPPLLELWEYELTNLRRQVSAFFAGFGKVMDSTSLPMHTHRWYWGPTRIISELPNNAGRGAIAEFPYFTFLYGDLHAHMIAFPITLLVILWLVAEIMGAGYGMRSWWESGLALALGALAVGVLRPTNTWDWITYLLLGGAGLTYVAWVGATRTNRDAPPSAWAERIWRWLRPGRIRDLWIVVVVMPLALIARVAFYFFQRAQADQQAARGLRSGETLIEAHLTLASAVLWMVAAVALVVVLYVAALIALRARMNRSLFWSWVGRVGVFVALTFVVGWPFTAYFASAYNSVKPWEQETTPIWAFMYVHGTFIFIVASYLVWQTARWLHAVPVRALEGMAVPFVTVVGGLLIVLVGSIIYGVREVAIAQIIMPLIAWAVVLFFLPRQSALLRATYALIVLALAITLGVEVVVLEGDIGRQNTVFKFYLQAWFMLSIVGGVALAWMLHRSSRWHPALRTLWQGSLTVLFMIAALYPVLATRARFLDRFNKEETPLTLDGMAYMQYAVHGEFDLYFSLEGDYDMIRWLQDHVEGTPVVMEAHLFPSEYHWGGRISIYTGLPTVLGWRFHQLQQHSLPDMNLLVQTRENNTSAFYSMEGADGIRAAMNLIDAYDIEYIVIGALERAFYGDIVRDPATNVQTAGHSPGLAKFDTMVSMGLLTLEYSADRCLNTTIEQVEECPPEQVYTDKIYRVVPGATYGEPVAAR